MLAHTSNLIVSGVLIQENCHEFEVSLHGESWASLDWASLDYIVKPCLHLLHRNKIKQAQQQQAPFIP